MEMTIMLPWLPWFASVVDDILNYIHASLIIPVRSNMTLTCNYTNKYDLTIDILRS